ncbi:hypothetical protein [Thermococcus thermotolerans]|uniref:hypothetical protein n=1 Tax=Thermococcus thermotolerans TaxID=2969672 RepID=UPI0021577993|nr:hypothetical protein [Thermococcus thermotolerans]
MGLLGMIGAIILVFFEVYAIVGGIETIFNPPTMKGRVEEAFHVGLVITLGVIVGSILLYSDPEALRGVLEEHRWALTLIPIALALSGTSTIISYRRLKRFEQEEMLERLAEKMGEKLGESMAKGLKAKET